MRMARVLLGLAVGLTITLSACGEDREAGSSGDSSTKDAAGTAPQAPDIEVTDPGGTPRRLLEIEVEEGQSETTAMTLEQSQKITGTPEIETPPMTLSYTTTVVEATPDRIETEMVYDKAVVDGRGADPDLVAQMKSSLEPIAGLKGHSAISPRGENLGTTFDAPDDLPPVMASLMQQFSDQATALMVPFPDEPIGPGAEWTATSDLELNGIAVHQVMHYSLDALEGTTYRISVDSDQTFEPGSTEGLEIKSGGGTSHGQLRGDTRLLTPQTSTANVSTGFEGEAAGRQMEFRTQIKMSVRSGPSS
jgi:Family of unknown function (DUF6263)